MALENGKSIIAMLFYDLKNNKNNVILILLSNIT